MNTFFTASELIKKYKQEIEKYKSKLTTFSFDKKEILQETDLSELCIFEGRMKNLIYSFYNQRSCDFLLDIGLNQLQLGKKILYISILDDDEVSRKLLLKTMMTKNINFDDAVKIIKELNLFFLDLRCRTFQDKLNDIQDAIMSSSPDIILIHDIEFIVHCDSPNLLMEKICDLHNGPLFMTHGLGNIKDPMDLILKDLFQNSQIKRLISDYVMGKDFFAQSFADNIFFLETSSIYTYENSTEDRIDSLHILKNSKIENKIIPLTWSPKKYSYTIFQDI